MKYLMTKIVFGATALLAVLAAPCSAAYTVETMASPTWISAANITTSGTGANATVTNLNFYFGNILTTGPTIFIAPPANSLELEYSSATPLQIKIVANSTFTTAGFTNITAGTTIETIALLSALTANVGTGSGASFSLNTPNVNFAAPVVTTNPIFQNDLLAAGGGYVQWFTSLGVSAQEVGTSLTFNGTSAGLQVNSPEPASCFLMGGGLLLAGYLGRKRYRRVK
jgi:hypothetical protein